METNYSDRVAGSMCVSNTENGGPDEGSTPYQELLELGHIARERRCSGDHHNGLDSEFPLVGLCFDNALVMYHLLYERGYDPELVAGSTERVADELLQGGVDIEAVESVTEYGWVVHYWVRVSIDGEEWHVDVASDSWENLGECLVSAGLPAGYIMFRDSLTEGEELMRDVLEDGCRCSHCGDHAYTEGGCKVCIATCAV